MIMIIILVLMDKDKDEDEEEEEDEAKERGSIPINNAQVFMSKYSNDVQLKRSHPRHACTYYSAFSSS